MKLYLIFPGLAAALAMCLAAFPVSISAAEYDLGYMAGERIDPPVDQDVLMVSTLESVMTSEVPMTALPVDRLAAPKYAGAACSIDSGAKRNHGGAVGEYDAGTIMLA